MSELIVTIGPSGAGKSTVLARDYPDHVVVSPDAVREQISHDYSLSGPKHHFNYVGIFGAKLSELAENQPEVYAKVLEVVPQMFLNENQSLDTNVFNFVMQRTRNLLDKGENVVFDATTLSPGRWNPLITIARSAGARVVALWMTMDEFGDPEECRKQILRNNEERHIDPETNQSRGRFTPNGVINSMFDAAAKLQENPPPSVADVGKRFGFDEVIRIPIAKRDALAKTWLGFAKSAKKYHYEEGIDDRSVEEIF